MNRVEIYQYAKERLEQRAKKCDISYERLETAYYQPCREVRFGSEINNYFYLFCEHLADRQYMGNIIKFYTSDTQEVLKQVLFDYDVQKTSVTYKDIESIMQKIREINSNIIQNEPKWEEYLTGIYQCALYLTSGKIGDTVIPFDRILQKPVNANEMKVYVHSLRPIINNLCGVGTAVCYNWLKECGADWLAKPDLHIKRVVAELLLREMKRDDCKDIENIDLNPKQEADKIIAKFLRNCPEYKQFPQNAGISNQKKLTADEFVAVYMFEWVEEIRNSGADDTITAFKLDRILYLYCTNGYFYKEDFNSQNISEKDLLTAIQRISNT